ncbi:MAG: radical SAM protein, partial [Promethearchaeota archaeon]
MVEKIRVSTGTAALLGLNLRKFKILPSTCYFMTYHESRCSANCGFCPQAREAKASLDKLSRIIWPVFSFDEVLNKMKKSRASSKIKRICLQVINYKNFLADVYEIIYNLKKITKIPISVALPPVSINALNELENLGVDRVGIALDCATPELFDKIKGKSAKAPYSWENHMIMLKEALKIFPNRVSTHLIVGMGETEQDIITQIFQLKKMQVLVSLFAFTPIKGTQLENLEQPSLVTFRKIQLARYLIFNDNKTINDFIFNSKGKLIKIKINKEQLKEITDEGNAFLTTGCPGC